MIEPDKQLEGKRCLSERYKIKIFYLLLCILSVGFILKYVFIDPEPGNTELVKFKNSVHFIWWIILFESLITAIIYKNVRNEHIKDYLIVVLFSCIILTIAFHNGIHLLQGSPSGDHRYYMVQSQKVLAGHWPWEDPFYQGELSHYSYLYFTIIAIISKLFPISLGKLYILLNVVNKAIAPFVMYWAGKRLFSRWVGLLAAFISLLHFHYWGGPQWPAAMFQVLILVWFYKEKYLRSGISLGILVLFYYPTAIVTFLAMTAYRFFCFLSIEDETASENLKILARTFLTAGLVGALFTFPILLKYQFIPRNTAPYEPLASVYNLFSGLGGGKSLNYVLLLIGLIVAFLRKEKKDLLLLSWFTACFLIIHQDIFTYFNISIYPMQTTRAITPVIILLMSVAVFEILKFLHAVLRNTTEEGIKKETFLKIGVIAIIIMWGPSSIGANLGRPAIWDIWEKPDHQGVMRTMGWINNNTDPDDVILSDYGYAFSYIGPHTGRKVVFVGPQAFSNLFIDPEIRGSDYNYMYYGSNFTKIKGLLIKYNVKYVIDSRNTYYGTSKNKTLTPFDFSKHKEFKRQSPWDIWGIYEFIPTSD